MDYIELVTQVEEDPAKVFKAMAILNELEKEIKECKDQIRDILIQEASNYSEKTFDLDGLKIEKRSGSKTYNFKDLEEWNACKKSLKECEDRYKAAYSNYEKGLSAVKEDGEILELPEVKYSRDVVIIKNLGESLIR